MDLYDLNGHEKEYQIIPFEHEDLSSFYMRYTEQTRYLPFLSPFVLWSKSSSKTSLRSGSYIYSFIHPPLY